MRKKHTILKMIKLRLLLVGALGFDTMALLAPFPEVVPC